MLKMIPDRAVCAPLCRDEALFRPMTAFNLTRPTLSDDTKENYLRRYRQLYKRFSRDTNDQKMSADELVAQLILLKPSLTMGSWRTYKNAVLYALETLFPSHETAIEVLKSESSATLAKTSSNTSGRKVKHVTEGVWQAIQSALRKRSKDGHRHSQALLDFGCASLATGLRPSEWCFSEIGHHADSGREVLRVRNAKHSNGRANGAWRELFIDELDDADRAAVSATLAYCAAANEQQAAQTITALRNEIGIVRSMAVVTAKRPQSNVTLYSFRHQFIADAKTTFEDPVLISALVGHNSTKTAFEHYGKRRFGMRGVRVYPTPDSVAAVQNVHLETYKAFLAERLQSQPFSL